MWVGRPGFADFATAWTSNRTVSLLKPLLRGLVRVFGSRPLLRVYEVWPGTAFIFLLLLFCAASQGYFCRCYVKRCVRRNQYCLPTAVPSALRTTP